MVDTLGTWLESHLKIPGLPGWASVLVIAVAMAVVSIAFTIIALINIPADYFCAPRSNKQRFRHPILHWTFRILRNILGWFLITLGILLSLPGIPGQGLLTVLLGIMLVEFPGKHRLQQRFIRWPRIHKAVDSVRKRFGRPPLQLDDKPQE